MDRVLLCCDDAFFRVNIEARIRAAGLSPLAVMRVADLRVALPTRAGGSGVPALGEGAPRVRAAVIDLHALSGEAVEIISRLTTSQPGTPVLAFGAHLERALIESAERAGAVAVPSSSFMELFPAFLERVALGLSPAAPGTPPAPENPLP